MKKSMTLDAKQVMKNLLQEVVLPKCKDAQTKQDFVNLSNDFTWEASFRANEAGITGEEYGFITNAFIERSLGVIYDVHTRLDHCMKAMDQNMERAHHRLVLNGRKKTTVNKVLLADAYLGLMKSKLNQVGGEMNTGSTTKATDASTQTYPADNVQSVGRFEREVSAENTPPARTRTETGTNNRTAKEAMEAMSDITNVCQLKETNESPRDEFNAVKLALQLAEEELQAAKTAQLAAEHDLKVQADVLSQTLTLLGDATAKISDMKKAKIDKDKKSRSEKFSSR